MGFTESVTNSSPLLSPSSLHLSALLFQLCLPQPLLLLCYCWWRGLSGFINMTGEPAQLLPECVCVCCSMCVFVCDRVCVCVCVWDSACVPKSSSCLIHAMHTWSHMNPFTQALLWHIWTFILSHNFKSLFTGCSHLKYLLVKLVSS